MPQFTPSIWFVPPWYLIPAGWSFTYSSVDEPWQCGKGRQCQDVRSRRHGPESVRCHGGERCEEGRFFAIWGSSQMSIKETVWVKRHHKDVLFRHRQQSWYIPRVIFGEIGQDVYVIQVGNNKMVERDHTKLLPREQFTAWRISDFSFIPGLLFVGAPFLCSCWRARAICSAMRADRVKLLPNQC